MVKAPKIQDLLSIFCIFNAKSQQFCKLFLKLCSVFTLGRDMISLITNETCFAKKVFSSDGALCESGSKHVYSEHD